MPKEFTLKKGSRLWMGNYPFLLSSDVKGVFETIPDNMDILAEALATNQAIYAMHKDDLTHEEDGFEAVTSQRLQADKKSPVFDAKGQPVFDTVQKSVKVHVSYGLHGARIEQKPGDVVDAKKVAAEQAKAVTAADAEAKKAVKVDEALVGTPAETAARIKEQEQQFADAKGLADAESRRKMELDRQNRPGGA